MHPSQGRSSARAFDPQALARWLVQAHAQRETFTRAPQAIRARTAQEATAAQQAFVRLKSAQCGPTVGWKIALSTPVMQKMVGLAQPVAGRLHQKQIVQSPAQTDWSSYTRLIVEFEIAVVLRRDLQQGPLAHTAASARSAVGWIAPAMELADDRLASYPHMHDKGLELTADNAWNEGVIRGEQKTLASILPNASPLGADDPLANLAGQVWRNGEPIGQGTGRDLMGHPLEALAWLANAAHLRGESLKKGELCILGSLVSSQFPKAGDRFEYKLGEFAPIALQID